MTDAEILILVETIQKLLKEESDLKTYLSSQFRAFIPVPERIRLMQVKIKLKVYPDWQINLARHWNHLAPKKKRRPVRNEEEDVSQKYKQEEKEDNSWRIFLFLLLAADKPYTAFLALSFSWPALLLFMGADDEPSAPEPQETKPQTRQLTNTA